MKNLCFVAILAEIVLLVAGCGDRYDDKLDGEKDNETGVTINLWW